VAIGSGKLAVAVWQCGSVAVWQRGSPRTDQLGLELVLKVLDELVRVLVHNRNSLVLDLAATQNKNKNTSINTSSINNGIKDVKCQIQKIQQHAFF
jgi:hypothetical protein